MNKHRGIDYNNISRKGSIITPGPIKDIDTNSNLPPVPKREIFPREVKVINTEKLNVRSSPSITKNNVVRILNHGDVISIKDENEEWAYIIGQHKPVQEFVMKKFLKEV